MADIRKWTVIVIVIMVSGLFYWGSVVAQESQPVQNPVDTMTDFTDRWLYIVNIELYSEVDAILCPKVEVVSELDTVLVDSSLTDYLKLRVRNNFAQYPIVCPRTPQEALPDSLIRDKCGIWIDVWTVGTSYPIAYHIEMKCTIWNWPMDLGDANKAHSDAVLGICSPANAESAIKQGIDEMVERFAMVFLKAKGDI